MEETEMSGDRVYFCTDNQCISLHPREPLCDKHGWCPHSHWTDQETKGEADRGQGHAAHARPGHWLLPTGMGSAAVAPAAPKMRRRVEATLAFMVVAVVSFLVALLVVALQPRADPSFQEFQLHLGDNTTWPSPVDPGNSYHFGRVAEVQEALQMFKENSSTWAVEMQLLKYSVDNISSQIQMLSGHLENTSADVQMVKGVLEDAGTWTIQTQMLKSSLEGADAEIQGLKRALEKANTLNSQTHDFLQGSSENTSVALHMLSQGLENANAEIQMLKAGLETAKAQAQLANTSLKNVSVQIHLLKGNLGSVNVLRTQHRVLSSGLERANAEIQRLWGSLRNASAFNSQTQTFVKGSLDNTSAEIQLLRGQLERAGDEIQLLKRDLETATAQTQMANSGMEQTKAQLQGLKAELENASGEIGTLKQGMKDAALNSQTQMLENRLQEAHAEIQRLRGNVKNTSLLSVKILEQQRSLESLRAAFASLEQLQRTQNQLLQLMLQGWKAYRGSLYYFSEVKKSWNAAEQFCVSQGAHLASVTSEEEQMFLTQFTSSSYHWIGLTDRGTEGSWRWVDGTLFSDASSQRFWGTNQPDNWRHGNGHTEDCVHIQQKWNDMYCDATYQWVCKKSVGQAVA